METEISSPNGSGRSAETRSLSLDSLKGLKGIEYRKAWNKLHRDRCRRAEAEWRQRNPEKVKASMRAFAALPETVARRKAMYGGTGEGKKRYYSGAESAPMRYLPWGDVEDCMVMDHKIPDRQLSLEIGRSVRAIQMRRNKLNAHNLE